MLRYRTHLEDARIEDGRRIGGVVDEVRVTSPAGTEPGLVEHRRYGRKKEDLTGPRKDILLPEGEGKRRRRMRGKREGPETALLSHYPGKSV